MDLRVLGVRELLALDAGVISELKRRGLVRTNNKPLADIAEQIVLRARGGSLEPNSAKSHDLTTPAGLTIQVKAMGERTAGDAAVFGMFRSFDFDSAVFLKFGTGSFELEFAREVPAADVQASSRFSSHTNAWLPSLRWVRGAGADVTEEMRSGFESLDVAVGPSGCDADEGPSAGRR